MNNISPVYFANRFLQFISSVSTCFCMEVANSFSQTCPGFCCFPSWSFEKEPLDSDSLHTFVWFCLSHG